MYWMNTYNGKVIDDKIHNLKDFSFNKNPGAIVNISNLVYNKLIPRTEIRVGDKVQTTEEYNEQFKGRFNPFCGRVMSFSNNYSGKNNVANVQTCTRIESVDKIWLGPIK